MPLNVIQEENVHEFVERTMAPNLQEPPPPASGIYEQRLPFWIRWPVRFLLVPFLLLDILMQKFARIIVTSPYKWHGKCKKRGACCHFILIEKAPGLVGKMYLWWHMEINGFFPRQEACLIDGKKKYKIMGCRYLKKDGKCGSYKTRPLICRKWPILMPIGRPEILKGCGYKPELRKKYLNQFKH
jgi:hypothetical protein